jgi:hypothetical protein
MNSPGPLCPLDRRPLPKGSLLIELPVSRASSEDTADSDAEDWTMERGSAKLDEITRIILGLEAQDPTEKVRTTSALPSPSADGMRHRSSSSRTSRSISTLSPSASNWRACRTAVSTAA